MKTIKFLVIDGKPVSNLLVDKSIYFSEDGTPIISTGEIDLTKLKDYVKDTIIWLEKEKVQKKLSEKGFYSISDVLVYKSKGDIDAEELYEWYISFDSKVWDWIENELSNKTNEELLEIDLKALVETIAEEADGN